MKITFSGKQDKLNASQERKLAMAFAKLSKLLERKGEKEAQVILSHERHLHHAEVRLNFYDNALFGQAAATDQFTSVMDAITKVEKQALKTRTKWRENKRDTPLRVARTEVEPAALEALELPAPASKSRTKARVVAKRAAKPPKPAKIVRATGKSNGKPMTVDEAMIAIEMDDERDYVVYRDSETDQLRVLIRRRDGRVDLVEA